MNEEFHGCRGRRWMTTQLKRKTVGCMPTCCFDTPLRIWVLPLAKSIRISEPSPIHIETTLPTTPTRQRPPKRIKICEPSPIPIHTFRRHPARQAPPKPNPKNPRTLTPILEVRTPIAQAIWEKKDMAVPSVQTTDPKSHFSFWVPLL